MTALQVHILTCLPSTIEGNVRAETAWQAARFKSTEQTGAHTSELHRPYTSLPWPS